MLKQDSSILRIVITEIVENRDCISKSQITLNIIVEELIIINIITVSVQDIN